MTNNMMNLLTRTRACVVAVMLATLLTGCAKAQAEYSEQDFEKSLVDGQSLDGKTVEITVKELNPESAFGYNIIAGEHLNFVSPSNPGVKVGDKLIVKVTGTRSVLGSWVIDYKKM